MKLEYLANTSPSLKSEVRSLFYNEFPYYYRYNGEFLVGTDKGDFVGFINISKISPSFLLGVRVPKILSSENDFYFFEHVLAGLYISSIAVPRKLRGQGYGKQLLKQGLLKTREMSFGLSPSVLLLEAEDVPSSYFWKSLNFENLGTYSVTSKEERDIIHTVYQRDFFNADLINM